MTTNTDSRASLDVPPATTDDGSVTVMIRAVATSPGSTRPVTFAPGRTRPGRGPNTWQVHLGGRLAGIVGWEPGADGRRSWWARPSANEAIRTDLLTRGDAARTLMAVV